MKKSMKKLSLARPVVRTLTTPLAAVTGGMGDRDGTLVSNWFACRSDNTCGDSHAPTCGDAPSRCEC